MGRLDQKQEYCEACGNPISHEQYITSGLCGECNWQRRAMSGDLTEAEIRRFCKDD